MGQESCGEDADGDGWTTTEGDCDDGDPAIHPGASEVCDGVDNDCDNWIDEQGVTVYDLEADMVPGENPNGDWRFGWAASIGADPSLYTEFTEYDPLAIWGSSSETNATFGFNESSEAYTSDCCSIDGNQTWAHPGTYGEYSVVRWTSPVTGTCTIAARFEGLDWDGCSTDVHILLDSEEIYSTEVTGYLSAFTYDSEELTVQAGSTIDIDVGFGSNGNWYNDSTGISLVLTCDGVCGN